MDNERCTAHGQTRCSVCAFREAKKRNPKPTVAQPVIVPVKAGAPPPNMEGLDTPPSDIEAMDTKETHEAREAYDKEMEDLLAAKARNEAINAQHDQIVANIDGVGRGYPSPSLPGPAESTEVAGFDTLPVDDSHASKVVRAASEYADAARDYALKLANYTKVEESTKTAAKQLTEAALVRDRKESELKTLVAGGGK